MCQFIRNINNPAAVFKRGAVPLRKDLARFGVQKHTDI